MATVNTKLLDATISHQVGLVQYANGLVRKIMALLTRADVDLTVQLTQAVVSAGQGSATVQRIDSLLLSVRQLNASVYKRIQQQLDTNIRALAMHEIGFQGELLSMKQLLRIPLVGIAPDQVYAAVMARPFQGRLLREWVKSIEVGRMTRVRDAVRMGFVQGQTANDIVKRVMGTKANNYSDGIIEIDRRNAESVVRTAVSHTAAVARESMFDANTDVIKAVQWVSTLDDKTSQICQIRDGLHYSVDAHEPIGHAVPWLGGPGQAHWNCRSTAVAVLKSWAEMGIDMAEMPATERASMDGAVPADTTYGEWFGRQSAARQDKIVGPTRGKLFRQGGISFDKFFNDKGRMLTLEELRLQDASALGD